MDQGSWTLFASTLTVFLKQASPLLVLLTTPAPDPSTLQSQPVRGWRRLFGWREPVPSPEPAGVVITARAQGCQLDVPVLDEEGRALLPAHACSALEDLGWHRATDVYSAAFTRPEQAVEALTRILIEILGVPHPADLDYLVTKE